MTYTEITESLIFCEDEKCLYDKSFSPPRMIFDCYFLNSLGLKVDDEADKLQRDEIIRRIGWAYQRGREEAQQETLQKIAAVVTGKNWYVEPQEEEE